MSRTYRVMLYDGDDNTGSLVRAPSPQLAAERRVREDKSGDHRDGDHVRCRVIGWVHDWDRNEGGQQTTDWVVAVYHTYTATEERRHE